ncbi:MAG: bifunctional (p)ppGpp synthetase/guanosine-3',5'-bis(diphosphate) 3'-pyrophosphohydrolase, partial [Myxococcales bacterium]|nr:bifunctional (p)ppGpp synthetase/guanosine-3',5'-bis(diphosphate) 3'-pyrophosphohydrolase [Myxococcales bacterium]
MTASGENNAGSADPILSAGLPSDKRRSDDPVAAVLAACREHHGEEQLTALETVLLRRRELADVGSERALRRTVTLAELRLDPPTLIASALALVGIGLDGNAAIEAGPETPSLTTGVELDPEVGGLLEGVERLAAIHWDALDEESAESLRRMFVAMAADVRVVLITLCDRLEVIRELRLIADADVRRRIAGETREVFAPLANRLGIWQLKWELEDLAMRELEPVMYKEITGKLANKRIERQRVVDKVISTLESELANIGVLAEVNGRPKHIYSIVNKMRRKGVGFEDIYDVTALRVIIDAEEEPAGKRDCYAVLGMVHGLWTPISGEFDDYVARPKDNGYASLHTAVVGPGGEPLEIQIRTRQMHLFAEFGVAAHWAYKEGKRAAAKRAERFNLLRQLVDWQKQLVDPKELAEALKTDLFGDQVHVFTPDGDVIDLPEGATPLDFAYRIHTMVGHRCRGARVNGVMVPLTHKLRTGDRVEILTKKQPEPSRDWLSPHLDYLHTASAKQKVRHWFRQQDRDQAVISGREALERELSRAGVGAVELGDLDALAWDHDYKTGDDLLAA